ncbi:MAG TPA: Pycsar system effector family protein [Polyangiaceae bacterium]|nr:Pycsar system effector family protein [Polyangiaceae bacterium]
MHDDAQRDYADALAAVTLIAPMVNNADTKIGILGAAATVLIGAEVRDRSHVAKVIHHAASGRGTVALALLAVSGVALAVTMTCLLNALMPRLPNVDFSRFAFPCLAERTVEELRQLEGGDVIRTEAWIEAHMLSRILVRKYESFRGALLAATAAGLTFGGWLVVAPSVR